jgi:creatinine amidohydrolase
VKNIWNTETSYEISNRKPRFALIPIGSFEQHGKHLPVTTDTLIAGLLGKAICDAHNGLLVSPVSVTCSHEHAGFPGSLSISSETLIHVLKDLIASIEAEGFPLTVLVNGHGGNYVVANVVQELNVSKPHVFMCPARQHWQAAISGAGVESSMSEDMHGGEIETSILMYAMPEVVRHDQVEDWEATDRPLLTLYGMHHYTKSGIIGFPSKASSAKGKLLLEKMAEVIGKDIETILSSL